MKFLLTLFVLAAFAPTSFSQQALKSDSLGLPGDNLNLYAVLDVFQKSATLEAFEKTLNDEESKINNLDLNSDDKADYIRVIDHVNGNSHAIVLQVAINENETQDVAVIEVNRDEKNLVTVQVIGDKELYGDDYIIEPNYDSSAEIAEGATPNPAYKGSKSDTTISDDGKTIVVNHTSVYEVANWQTVRYIYEPDYVVWVSPWHYGYYPPLWNPWSPYYWHFYYGYHHNYYQGYYRRWHHYRNPRINVFYGTRRTVSPVMVNRRNLGDYKKTYTKPELRKDGVEQFNRRNIGRMNPPTNRMEPSKPMITPTVKPTDRPSTKPTKETPRRRLEPIKKPTDSRPIEARPPQTKPTTRPSVPNNRRPEVQTPRDSRPQQKAPEPRQAEPRRVEPKQVPQQRAEPKQAEPRGESRR